MLPAAVLADRYERLRRYVVENHVSPQNCDGVALFLRRGMWRWGTTEAIEAAPHLPDLNCLLPGTDGSPVIVHLLAQVAVATTRQRKAL